MSANETQTMSDMTVTIDRRRNRLPVVDSETGLLWFIGKYGVAVRYEQDPHVAGWLTVKFPEGYEERQRVARLHPGRRPSDRAPRTMAETRAALAGLGNTITGKVLGPPITGDTGR